MVEVDCDYCGATLERYPYQLEPGRSNYCDYDCKYADEREDRVTVECDHCGETFERRVGRVEKTTNNYCDLACKHAALRDRVEVECATCGATLERLPSTVRETKRQFCDIDCKAEWQEEHYLQDGSPNWAGGADTYMGPRWDEHRETALERDNHDCAVCGLSNGAHETLYGSELAVHHVTPRDECDSWQEANAQGNLMAVCLVCHCRVFDSGYYTPGGVRPATATRERPRDRVSASALEHD